MAMKLPTYNQPGWGATLNNYLRELNQRISKVEANNGSYSNGVGQVFGASAFSTGLTSVAGTCIYNEIEKYSTFQLGSSGLIGLSFTGEYFISQSTVEGNAFLGKLDGAEWGSNIVSLDSNQVMLICADEDRTLQIIPFTQAKNNRELDYNLCRLGYLTKIDDSHVYFTPCPNLATMDLHDKYNYIMRPTYKSNDENNREITVGSYSYMMEGLNYYKHFENQNKTNATPLQVLDGELYNVHTFANVVTYFLIQKNETGKEEIVGEYSSEELENHINYSEKNKIFIFYVTMAGIIFVREISLKEGEQIIDSTSLANYPINTEFNDSNVLFYNYSWLKPLELKRCGKDPFGKLRWHMASYNGISPQIVGTPIHTVDTNYYWADNYLLQIKNSDESARNYYGLRIRPYVQLDMNHDEGDYDDRRIPNEEKTNAYVVLNVSDQSTPLVDSTKPGIFLYKYPFAEDLYFGGYESSDSVFSITKYDTEEYYQLTFNKPIRQKLTILSQADENRYAEIASTGSAPHIKFQSTDGGYNSLFNSFSVSLRYGNRNIISLNSNPSNDDSSFFSINNSVTSTLFRISKNESIINSLETKIIGKNSVLISDTDATPYLFNLTREGGLILDTHCSAVDFTVTSDIRYKNLHSNFTDSGLNIIEQLPIYNYSLKTAPNKETIGITAQDLLKVLPQLVDTSDESHYKINESKLVYVCMQAIKELNNQIKILKQEISDLRGN